MDLNNIQLPAWVVADLYKSSLIETGDAGVKVQPDFAFIEKKGAGSDEPVPNKMHAGWKWMGENRKNILVIVHYPDVMHLPDDVLRFLTGVLVACKLGIEDVAIVNLNNHPGAGIKELGDHFKCRVVLLFGIEPGAFGLPMNFPHFQLQPFSNCTFLSTPALKELEEDKVLKSKLWVCLRRIFNL